MAIRHAVATGSWSSTATWNGGTLPTAGDDVFANGFTVTINQNITVTKISTEICPTTSIGGGGFSIATSVNLSLTCNVVAGTSTCLVINDGNGRTTITGNVYGGTGVNAAGMYLNATSIGSLATQPVIYGNLIGGTATGTHGLNARGDRPYYPTLYGNALAGTGGAGLVLASNQNTSSTIIYGNVTANGSLGCFAGGSILVFGTVTASSTQYGLQGFSITYVAGSIVNVAGYWGVYTPRLFVATGNTMQFTLNEQTTNNNITLYSANSFVGIPSASDVRQGTVYGVSSTLTGTLKVPPAGSVAVGVPVDNTVGTAIISITDMGALLASYNV